MKTEMFFSFLCVVGLPCAFGNLFVDFGPVAGDRAFWDEDSDYCLEVEHVNPGNTFTYLGANYDPDTVKVCPNGLVCLEVDYDDSSPQYRGQHPNATAYPCITALYRDLDFDEEDSIIYARLETDSNSVLGDIDEIIQDAYDSYSSTTVAFIATYIKVHTFYQTNKRATFQVVLATDDVYTFVILNYYQINANLNGTYTSVGFGNGTADGADTAFFNHPYSFSDNLTDALLNGSNVGEPGRFVYRVDSGDVEVEPNTNAVTFGEASEDDVAEKTPNNFFSFGILADDLLIKDDDDYECMNTTNITFYEVDYHYVCVSTNGLLSFGDDEYGYPSGWDNKPETPSVLPLWTDLDSEWYYGVVYYRYVNTSADADEIDAVLQGNVPYTSTRQAVIATWVGVPLNGDVNSTSGTFQATVATDGAATYAIFHYEDLDYGTFNWTNLGVGFSDGDDFWRHPYGNPDDVYDLETESNVGVNGRWIYRIDTGNITDYETDDEDGVDATFRITNEAFSSDLRDTTSDAYNTLYWELEQIILDIIDIPGAYIVTMIFGSGSVVVDFVVGGVDATDTNADAIETSLTEAAENDEFGSYSVDADSVSATAGGDDDNGASACAFNAIVLITASLAAMWSGKF